MKKYISFILILSLLISIVSAATMKDFKKAKHKCKNNNAKACSMMFYYYAPTKNTYIPGLKEDNKKALFYSEKACRLNNADGCFSAGILRFYPDPLDGSLVDKKLAIKYFKKACRLGEKDACGYIK